MKAFMESTMQGRVEGKVGSRAVLPGLLIALALGPGLGCNDCGSTPPGSDGGPGEPEPELTIVRPAGGATITPADDTDAETEGIQIDVEVAIVGKVVGEVTLTNSAGGGPYVKTASEGDTELLFSGVTIAASEEGTENDLSVGAEGAFSDTITVTGTLPPSLEPFCEFASPEDGATLSEDADGNALNGFQIRTLVRCGGEGVSAGALVEVHAEGPGGAMGQAVQGTLQGDGGGLSAEVVIPAADEGENTLVVELVSDRGVSDSISVTVEPAPPEGDCVAVIASPADDAVFGPADPDAAPDVDGYQIEVVLEVGEESAPACEGASYEVLVNSQEYTGELSGGTATVEVTLEDGANTIGAQLILDGEAGPGALVQVTADLSGPVLEVVGIPECDLADGCFNASVDTEDPHGEVFSQTITVRADAVDGTCPFTVASLVIDGGDPVAADGAWALIDGETRCEATFTAVELYGDLLPDEVVRTLEVSAAAASGVEGSVAFALGLDRVAPTLTWLISEPARFGISADQNPETQELEVRLVPTVVGMGGRILQHVALADGTVLGECTLPSSPSFCATTLLPLPDGSHVIEARGSDAAGNPLVGEPRTLILDGQAPCVESLSVSLDQNGDGYINAEEAGGTPAATQVTVTFGTDGCALEDGRQVTLTSSLSGASWSVGASGNGATFSGVELGEGSHTLTVSASDLAGNPLRDEGRSKTVVVDLTAPTCTILAPVAQTLLAADDLSQDPELQIAFRIGSDAGDGRTVELFDGALRLGGGALAGGEAAILSDAGSPYVTLAQGTRNIAAVCTDAAGNEGTSAAYTPLVDTIAPQLSFVDPPTQVGLQDDADPDKAGVQTSLQVSHVYLDAGQVIRIYRADENGQPSGAVRGQAAAVDDSNDGTSRTQSIPVTLFDCEACDFVVRATDASGNTALSAVATITVEAGFYDVVLTNPDGSNDPLLFGVGENTVAFEVTTDAPAGSIAELYLDGGATPVQSVTTTGATVTFDPITLNDGTGTVEIVVHNDAESKIGTTGQYGYEVDTEPPVVSWANPAGPSVRLTANAQAASDVGPYDTSAAPGYQQQLTVSVQGCAGRELVVVSDAHGQVNDGSPPTVPSNDEPSFLVGVSVPDAVGQSLTVECRDGVGNLGADTIAADVDTVIPGSPSDLIVNVLDDRAGRVEILFTAPGDDGFQGTAAAVVISGANVEITDANFESAPATSYPFLLEVDPVPAGGTGVTVEHEGLAFETTWYFGVRARDPVGNLSEPIATATARPELRTTSHINDDSDDPATPDVYGVALALRAGDLNGDGIDDFAWSAWNDGADCSGAYCNGSLFVLYGTQDPDALEQAVPQKIQGLAAETLGYDVAIVPSINGEDTIADLIAYAFDASDGPCAYVFYGVDGGQLPDRPNFRICDATSVRFGFGARVGSPGDVNGDGVADWIVVDRKSANAAQVAYLFFGTATRLIEDPMEVATPENTTHTKLIPAANNNTPIPLSIGPLGNIDAPDATGADAARDDFALGLGFTTVSSTGRIYVLRGRSSWPSEITLEALAAPDQVITPTGTNRVGVEVSGGELDAADGVDLVAKGNEHVVVFLNDGTGTFAQAYRMEGNSGNAAARTGMVVGDLNVDGLDDVAIGSSTGAFLYFSDGRTSANRTTPNVKLEYENSSYFVGGVGDLDKDGYPDLAISQPAAGHVRILHGP